MTKGAVNSMSNSQIVSDYMRAVFIERDLAMAEFFFGSTKTEHTPKPWLKSVAASSYPWRLE